MPTHPLSSQPASKPPLKWLGSKARLLPHILPLLPPGRRLIEPFLGAGSVFLASNYDSYFLGDANPDLMAMWVALKQRPREFCERAASYFMPEFHSREAYLQLRATFNSSEDKFERAALVPYLNRFGFNGLYRVNKSGIFNVPYGSPARLPALHLDRFEAAAAKLERATLLNGGFMGTLEHAGEGDVVYADPPYLAAQSGADSFTGYTQGGFGLAEHVRLLECCKQAASRGATVLISNHDSAEVRALYAGLRIETLTVRRSLAASADARGMAAELVAFVQPV